MKRISSILFILVLTGTLYAQKSDSLAVRSAVLDYVEGIYNVQPDRIKASVSKDLVKFGHFMGRRDSTYRVLAMTFDELVHTAETHNVKGWIPKEAPKSVEILHLGEEIASVKLNAIWGYDLIHLSKQNGTWKIYHVIWQSYSRK